jgi:hypothetical protein
MNQEKHYKDKYLFEEIPIHFVWNSTEHKWDKRKKTIKDVIGRLSYASIRDKELYYFRQLLLIKKGPKSFEELLMFNE